MDCAIDGPLASVAALHELNSMTASLVNLAGLMRASVFCTVTFVGSLSDHDQQSLIG